MHDIVIANVRIVDGDGGPAYEGAVGITGDRISAVGDTRLEGHERVDAAGMTLTPGFIDIHTHYDAQITWDRWTSLSGLPA